jgi:hypothetical protein
VAKVASDGVMEIDTSSGREGPIIEIDRLEAPHPVSSPSMTNISVAAMMSRGNAFASGEADAELAALDRFMRYLGGVHAIVDSLPRDL